MKVKLKLFTITAAVILTISVSTINFNAAIINDNGYTGYNLQQTNVKTEQNLPEKYSSADLGECSDVKTQGENDCWVYATVSTLESLLLHNNLFTLDISTNHLDNWGTRNEKNEGWLRSAGEGGYSYIPLGYITSWSGPVKNNYDSYNIGVNSVQYLDKNDTDAIMSLIMKSGAVFANLNYYSRGISTDDTSLCINRKINNIEGHGVSVVGWDNSYSKDNFNGLYKPDSDGAWLCKNSWGNYNSLGGYFWVSYCDYYIFNNDVFGPSYGVDEFQIIDNDDFLYQNEIYGATYEFCYENNTENTYINVFDFSENGNILDKVIFESTSVGAEYSVSYVPTDNGVPEKNSSCWTKLSQGIIESSGYVCDDIKDTVIPDKEGSIAVTINTGNCDKNTLNSIGVDEWLSNSSGRLVFIDTAQYNKSFLYFNDEMTDLKEYYHNINDDVGGTFVIKTVTSGIEQYFKIGDINNDCSINIEDASLLQKYLADKEVLSEEQLNCADFNNDDIININDVTAIQKYIANVS